MVEDKKTVDPACLMDSAAIETCPNCDTSLLGSHCHHCGQKKIDASEYSLKQFIGRAINDFTDLESNKVLRTLSALIVRTLLKAVVLFACETVLFFAVNIGGYVIAYASV